MEVPLHPSSQPQSSFPQTPDEFESDPRVSFSKLDNKFILEVDEEHEYEYDDALKRWIPVLDSALLEKQGEVYAVQGVDESQPAKPVHKKRKQAYTNGEDEEGGRAIHSKKSKPSAEPRERKNTAIYVTSLPLDVTMQEVHEVFSRCGVIAEEIDKKKPRIKLYTDEQDNFKGDALILYFRAESVDLAIQMLDDTDFRLGQPAPNGKMKVAPADFSYKVQKDAPTKTNNKDKKKIIKKTQKLNNKLADWDDDDPSTIADTSSKWDKVVILKHLFTLAELEEDPAAMLEIKEDIRDECAKVGTVTNVVLYDQETDGVASVRYSTVEAANACVRVMNGRFFANKRVEAYIADGNEKFKKSSERKSAAAATIDFETDTAAGDGTGTGAGAGAGTGDADADADEEGKRLDRFGEWLEGGGGG